MNDMSWIYWASVVTLAMSSIVLVGIITYISYSTFCESRGESRKSVGELWNDFVCFCLAFVIAIMGVVAILVLLALALYNGFCQKFFKKSPMPSFSLEPD